MLTDGKQIAAARQLLGWSQEELAVKAGVSKPTVNRMEKELFAVKDELRQRVVNIFNENNVEFVDGGVRVNQRIVQIIEGNDCYLKLLEDAHKILRHNKGEFLKSGANERRSSDMVVTKLQNMRDDGIPMRSLIKNCDDFLRGAADEYRWMDDSLHVDSDVKVIYGNKVAYLMTWSSMFKVIIIEDAKIADENRRLFNYVWQMSKTPEKTSAVIAERYKGVK